MEYYEKKYKDALAKAREIHRNEAEKRFDIEWLFPELKESEDERIRKALVRFHKSTIDVDGIKGEDIITWLEKQGGNPAPININKMVMEYSQTKDGDFGLPVNCQIRAYRQGLTDAISTLNLEKQCTPAKLSEEEERHGKSSCRNRR